MTKKQRRFGLNFANRLAELAPTAPDDASRKAVYTVVVQIRKKYGLTSDEKKAEIIRLIRLGVSTEADLQRETLFHRDEIREAINTLLEEKLIRRQKISVTGNGRPSNCFFPVDE